MGRLVQVGAVANQIGPAQVVGQDQHDIGWPLFRATAGDRQYRNGNEQQTHKTSQHETFSTRQELQ